MCQISAHLQDAQLTKLLGQFIEVHKSQFFSMTGKFDETVLLSFFIQHFEKNWGLTSPLKAFINRRRLYLYIYYIIVI